MSESELLICIINDPLLLDPILEAFLEHKVRGATVVDSRGMGQILTSEVPIFTGLKTLFPGGGSGGHMIFSVIPKARTDEIIAVIDDICSNFAKPGIGFTFTIPVNRVHGFGQKRD